MNKTLLQTLSNSYQTSSSLVLIMDLQWRILWSNGKPEEIVNLPQQLQISPNHMENTTHYLMLGGIKHECRLLCNLHEGFRIAEIAPYDEVLRLDPEEISAAVHSISSACCSLYTVMEEADCMEDEWMLNAIIGNCFRIYRSAYLQSEIDRIRNGSMQNESCCMQTVLRTVHKTARSILRSHMNIMLDTCEPSLFLHADPEALTTAVLSALVLCCDKSTHFQETKLSLDWRDGCAVLTVHMQETDIPLTKDNKKIQDISAGNHTAETALLNLFCHICKGKWIVHENEEERIRTCTLTLPASDSSGGNIWLRSPQTTQGEGHFGKFSVILSCMHYRDMF